MDLWKITATQPTRELASKLTVSNGLVGVKDLTEIPQLQNGPQTDTVVYVNGFYDYEPIQYGEAQFGFPQRNQMMIPLPAPTRFDLWLDDVPVDLEQGQLISQNYTLSMQTGQFTHDLVWEETATGRQLAIKLTRLTSLKTAALLTQQVTVKALNFKTGQLRVISGLHAQATQQSADFDPRLAHYDVAEILANQQVTQVTPTVRGLTFKALQSDQQLSLLTSYDQPGDWVTDGDWTGEFALNAEPISVTKKVWFELGTAEDSEEAETALAADFDTTVAAQTAALTDFWATSDIEITGDDDSQLGIRFSQFGLLQAVGLHQGGRGIAAKGLTGSGYNGHYFWDTEIYEAPFFYWNHPELAKRLLMVRYQQMPHAKAYAQSLGLAGALFPWRTINGEESSAYFPASTAAIHIDADIAYLVIRYYQITHDATFMRDYGQELLVETSRLYLSYGNFDEDKGFVLNTVTGPDEYTALINNNAYTNYMAQFELRYLTDHFSQKDIGRFKVSQREWTSFQKAADEMYFETRGDLIAQDDSFLSKKRIDLARIPKDQFPLLTHFHPLVLYRLQVLKQADLLLAMVLLPEQFTDAQVQTNYDYYEPITTHDSSLSPAIYAIAAARLGKHDGAINFFKRTINTDLQNTQGNTADGLHLAAMGGSWITFAWGMMGLTVDDDTVTLRPYLPTGWTTCRFKLQYRGNIYTIKVTATELAVTGTTGDEVTIDQDQRTISIQANV
ncbi:glycosyl hydrolase family 65 protein [Lactiplantibacillus sp. WILCCON 0030]|uniref:Glycosyl hydrolase family 65 protein n=1 Tax=Lactiplantibacillus brownii TaxID=3069269 RepID=A0ABU1A5J5_9LACO|nr:glycosyl hydrolase family 65 protein [Lactiplantibacillus brownii]MDQ7936252.1 glycosyl hydrolase family 65 protein [Lactiplantibacillus brownii]